MKEFNVTGLCIPEKHYMVDIHNKLSQIKRLIDRKKYFTINRGRQYGKTTTLYLLEKMLYSKYIVASISFEGLDEIHFSSSEEFCKVFMKLIRKALVYSSAKQEYIDQWFDSTVMNFELLSEHIQKMCVGKKVILLIDEVDKTSNNQVFLNFISMLRSKYLASLAGKDDTFHSIILTGVYDIRNIKLKLVKEGLYTLKETEQLYNSPWNIAVDFNIDMSFSSAEIQTMLVDYEHDYHIGMDIEKMANEIYYFTSGYPYLVSKICITIEEKLNRDWSENGIKQAIKLMLRENDTLFDDMIKNMENNKELYTLLYEVIFLRKNRIFEISAPIVNMGVMYGILSEQFENVKVANKIFEIKLCNYFMARNEEDYDMMHDVQHNEIIRYGKFDMELCLQKFAKHYYEIFSKRDEKFLERHGGLLFLSFLRPLINGVGFYHLESETRESKRMDIIVNYGKEQFIIELKLWHGEEQHKKAYQQLAGYLEIKDIKEGYLLTFDFRKNRNNDQKLKWIDYEGKKIYDVLV